MSTASITHHPVPVTAAIAAVVAAVAFTAVTVIQNDTGSTAPSDSPQPSVVAQPHGKWHPTTAGGQTMLGN
jgi:hypothetical protein